MNCNHVWYNTIKYWDCPKCGSPNLRIWTIIENKENKPMPKLKDETRKELCNLIGMTEENQVFLDVLKYAVEEIETLKKEVEEIKDRLRNSTSC
jgi:hypothetical protein